MANFFLPPSDNKLDTCHSPGVVFPNMAIELPLSAYLIRLTNSVNQPLNLTLLLSPFGLQLDNCGNDEFLMVGHILDDLVDLYEPSTMIDPLDVAATAWELGHEPAKDFLETGPYIISQLWYQTRLNSSI